ncbi:hypothetical protein U91I_04133 [alpha proteobacterium U9-1i]|nr:hypothetical protein U91I_04133 [alpha proteobacterium U9-1i]
MRALFLACALLAAPTPYAAAQTSEPVALFSFEAPLRLSRWRGPPSDLQTRLNTALAACGQTQIRVDYFPGPTGTGAALGRLRACDGFQIAGEEGRRDLTEALYARLWPNTPAPSISERALVLTLSFENTDYHQFLWNVGQAADPHAWGTWGPFGATLGAGGEVQSIVAAIEAASPGAIASAFEAGATDTSLPDPRTSWRAEYCAAEAREAPEISGAALLLSLARPLNAQDRERLKDEFCSDAHFRIWYGAFRVLAARPEVVAAYDTHYAAQNRAGAARLAALYNTRRERSGSNTWVPTEIDWAFFLDRATQFTTNLNAAVDALDALPSDANPAQRRQAIARASLPVLASHRRLRLGRDVAFYVDGAELNEEESDAWRYYGARRAGQVGLSDLRRPAASPF